MSTPDNLSLGRRSLSLRATTLYAAVTAISFSAASSAPTPLYHLYQQSMGLSALTITLVFGAYAFAMLVSFLTVARLSDYVGRRPMVLAGLLVSALALVLFATAGSAAQLILARIVQGIATGIAMTTLGATILDTDRRNGAIYNTVTVFLGLMFGTLIAGALVAWAPLPTELVYLVLLAITAIEALLLLVVPETTTGRPGALKALVPHVAVPQAARPVMLRLLPLNIAGWSLGGFFLSLMPTVVAVATGAKSPFVGAAVVSALMFTASGTVVALRRFSAEQLLSIAAFGLGLGVAVTLGGIYLQSAAIMLAGTLVAGVGFGSAYAGTLRSLLPLAGEHERAGLLAAYFVQSYLIFAIPAILAGLAVPELGLVTTSEIYGAALIALALTSAMVATRKPAAVRLG